jgi:hypothetical protein
MDAMKTEWPSRTGTSLIGFVECAGFELIKLLWEPQSQPCSKTTHEWIFFLGDDVFTIYDYNGPNSLEIAQWWHVGGHGNFWKLVDFLIEKGLLTSRDDAQIRASF